MKALPYLDSKADGLKVQNCEDLVIRSLSVDWSGPPQETNGGYGVYPVACKRILVEKTSYIRGASDSGLYVGQTEDVVLRNNRITENVAGIEIENCLRADVYDNEAYGNTGGILVFSMPDLPVIQNGAKAHASSATKFTTTTLTTLRPRATSWAWCRPAPV